MKELNLMKQKLSALFPWNQARVTFICLFTLALIDAQTASLYRLAQKFKGKAKVDSHYKRIQRFFAKFDFDFDLFAQIITKLLPFEDKWLLCVDRTNWKLGKKNINLLVLGIAYNGFCVPILWTFLDKRGCSNTNERIELMKRFLGLFGRTKIAYVTADREFIGKDWVQFLLDEKISFRIRIRNNTKVLSNRSHQELEIYRLFTSKRNRVMVLNKKRKIWGISLHVVGLRTAKEYVIVITDKAPESAMADYKKRWDIEMLFSCLKGRGFDFEATHLSEGERVNKLMALLALAFCWCISQGELVATAKDLRVKKHGYKAKGTFRRGLESLTNILANISMKWLDFRYALTFFVL